jgi:hypothetical protein
MEAAQQLQVTAPRNRRTAILLLATAAILTCAAVARAEHPNYELKVTFDLSQSRIMGTATIDAARGTELSIYRGDLRILRLTNGGRDLAPIAQDTETIAVRAEGPVQIRYEGTFLPGPENDVIGRDTILLRGIWYPVVEGIYRYRVTATVPRGFVAISEADEVRRTEADGKSTFFFELAQPQRDWDGVTFVASRQWVSRRARYKDVDLSVHLLPRNAGRLEALTRQAQHYLQRLEGLLGRYPYKRLEIVENPVPLHYSLSMPTYILLTQKSVAADAAEDSALNHEIAHQWFGNAVLADWDQGNWTEGLATLFSDLLEADSPGSGWERRQRMMSAYQNNVADRAASPLSGFASSSDRVSRIIGYGKSALVFHMLRRQVGDERFFAAMRQFVARNLFRVAGWTEVRQSFEHVAATNLGWFFDQWVDGMATPELGIEGVSVSAVGGKHELRVRVTQRPPAFVLTVPVTFHFKHGPSRTRSVQITGERQEFRYLLEEPPIRVVLDENYDVFRRLTPAEVPPRIDTLLTRQRVTLMAPPGEDAKFGALIGAFERGGLPIASYGWGHEWPRKEGPAVSATRLQPPPWAQRGGASGWREFRTQRAATGAAATETAGTSLILLGENNPLIARLFGSVTLPRGGFTITVLKHPRSPGDVVAILTAVSKAEVDAAYGTLLDQRRYSVAAFDHGKLIHNERHNGQRGISSEIAPEHR